MKPIIQALTLSAVLLSTTSAWSAVISTSPAKKAGLFCEVCRDQGCDCTGSACTNCNNLTAAPSDPVARNRKATLKACNKAKARMQSNKCRFN